MNSTVLEASCFDLSQIEGQNGLWNLLHIIGLGLVAFFLVTSFILNLSNVSTVASHAGLRSCGYFHLVALLSAFNIVFYVVELLLLVLVTLNRIDNKFDFLPEMLNNHSIY